MGSEMCIRDRIDAGAIRLRPILMTTLTTILSMLPMGLGIGRNSEMMQGMALVIIGGLVASTVLAMFLMPAFYLLIRRENPDGTKRKALFSRHKNKENAAV